MIGACRTLVVEELSVPDRLKSAKQVVTFTIFLDLLGFGLIIPQLQYYADAFRATPAFIGMIQAIYSLMQFLFAPFWGRLSDRVGRRPVLLASIAGSVLSYVLFALARDAWTIFFSRMLAGITAANLSTAQAYISDITPPQERTRAMGLIGAAFGVGFILGPAVGGVLGAWGGNFAIGMAGAVLAAGNWLSAFLRLPESLPAERRRSTGEWYAFPLRDLPRVLALPQVGVLAIVLFTAIFAIANLESTFVLLTKHRYGLDQRECGYLFAYLGLLGVLVQGVLVGKLSAHFGEARLVLVGYLLQAPALLLIPFMPNVSWLMVVLAIMALGGGLAGPSLNSLLSKWAPADRRGEVFGVTQSLGSLARVVGPAWGGWSFGHIGMSAPYVSAAMLILLASAMVAWWLTGTTSAMPASRH
ncbi:MAG: MFS transporter [Armatimonadota bacterium]|nr:MFS transporter [bacterium]MCS7309329.1 MFS transporter [Armatimonadota bacterium]MDW8103724.1 MFS transporter [Armatimonadota bacterium]MDW8289735.1 MFS transporter [Armatimonadota bacterium]